MDASELPTSPARVPADDALWAELYFPRVEDLLRRLAQAEKNKRYSLQALLFGSWPITTGIIIALICLPGCATGAILLMAAGSLDVPRVTAEEQILGKADRLALVETKVRNPVAPAEISPPLMAFAQEAALPDAVSLRGTLQSAALTASTAPQPAQTASPRLARRSVGKPVSLKPPAVHPEAAPQPPALLQKLFGFVVPATALPSQPDQHQT